MYMIKCMTDLTQVDIRIFIAR